MALAKDSHPSSATFDTISKVFSSDEKARKQAIAKGKGIYAFVLANKQGQKATYYIDLKETGKVGQGAAPEGKKADITLTLSDEDFGKLVDGKANAQKLFMSGKLKVKGDVMKAANVEVALKAAQPSKAKL